MREIAEWLVPTRRASSSWDRPRAARCLITNRASSSNGAILSCSAWYAGFRRARRAAAFVTVVPTGLFSLAIAALLVNLSLLVRNRQGLREHRDLRPSVAFVSGRPSSP